MAKFKVEQNKHWPIIEAYKNGKLSHVQAEAQLKDLGCVDWEIVLYLDDDDGCEP